MFVVVLRFSSGRDRAAEFVPGHKAWIERGFADGVFLVAGSLADGLGGGIVAHGLTREELRARVADDPFVVHDVVHPEILELTPSGLDPRLSFLRS
jgi:uncharacterized protein YciI